MMRTSEYIEEAIEESYLLGLDEDKIRINLDQFVDICGQVIRTHVHDKKQVQMLAEKLARARALSLIEDRQEWAWGEDREALSREDLVERVARNKRLILRAIGECDPGLVERINQARFPHQNAAPSPNRPPPRGVKAHRLIVKIGSLCIILFVLSIIYLVLLQHV